MQKQLSRFHFRKLVPVFILVLFSSLIHSSAFAAKLPDGSKPPVAIEEAESAFMPGQVLVKFKSDRHVASLQGQPVELLTWEYLPFGYTRLYIEGDVLEACKALRQDPSVETVEPNYLRYLQITPNDPLFLPMETFSGQRNLILSNAETGWNIETGDNSVTIAVIDTGVDNQHEDLAGNLIPGTDFRGSEPRAEDDSGHGTAVCGVAGAVSNNNKGICGAAWNVKILPLRACGGMSLHCSVVDEVEAIQEAILQGADIINLSLGGFLPSPMEETAVNEAWDAGILIVAAAGNWSPEGLLGKFGEDSEEYINFPAGYTNVLGVSSVDYPPGGDLSQIQRSTFSNYGDAVSVCAVGKDVITTAPSVEVEFLIFSEQADYGRIDGTSFSTPLVSGLAAIIKSHFPNITNSELRYRLETTSVDIGPAGWDDDFGWGLVDYKQALIGSTFGSNSAFNIGVTTNPVLNDDVLVVVKVKVPIISGPEVSYSYWEGGVLKSGLVSMYQVPNNATVFSGRLNTLFSGTISFKVNGVDSGGNLPELEIVYFKGQSN